MKIIELNHVALYITNVERSIEFYEKTLQLAQLPRPAFSFPGAWFRLGKTQELHLIANYGPDFFRSHEKNHFAVQVDDLTSWEQHFCRIDATFAPRKQRPDGAWQVFLKDPDDHWIELFTY